MVFYPFCRRRDESSDCIQVKLQRKDGDAYRSWKVLRMERGIREPGVPPEALKLEVVPILRKESDEGKGDVMRRVVDSSALNEDGKAYPLTRDVDKGTLANANWERLDM